MSYIEKYAITPEKLNQQFIDADIAGVTHAGYEGWLRTRAERLAVEGQTFLNSLRT